jgi:hypothetical protein
MSFWWIWRKVEVSQLFEMENRSWRNSGKLLEILKLVE